MVNIVYELCVAPPDYGKPIAQPHTNLMRVGDIFYLDETVDSDYHWEVSVSDKTVVSHIGLIELGPEEPEPGYANIDKNRRTGHPAPQGAGCPGSYTRKFTLCYFIRLTYPV